MIDQRYRIVSSDNTEYMYGSIIDNTCMFCQLKYKSAFESREVIPYQIENTI